MIDPDFDIDDEVKLDKVIYIVVGKDNKVQQHPGGFKKFDYILQDVKTKKWTKLFIHQLQDAKLIKKNHN